MVSEADGTPEPDVVDDLTVPPLDAPVPTPAAASGNLVDVPNDLLGLGLHRRLETPTPQNPHGYRTSWPPTHEEALDPRSPRLVVLVAETPRPPLLDAGELALAWSVWAAILGFVVLLPVGQISLIWTAGDYGAVALVGPSWLLLTTAVWATLPVGGAQTAWLGLITALCAGWVMSGFAPWRGLERAPEGVTLRGRVGLAAVGAVLAVNIALTFATYFVALGLGGDAATATLPAEDGHAWAILLNAGMWEELVSRVLLIGVPLWLMHRAAGRATPVAAIWRGGLLAQGWDRGAVVLLIGSSFLFGLWHLGGFGLWKVAPTAVGGALFAWLYLRGGLPAAVLAHVLLDVAVFQLQWLTVNDAGAVTCLVALAYLPALALSVPLVWRLLSAEFERGNPGVQGVPGDAEGEPEST